MDHEGERPRREDLDGARRITPWRRYFGSSFDGIALEQQHEWNHGKLGTVYAPGHGGGDSSHFTALIRRPFLAILLPFTIVLRLLLLRPWTIEVLLDATLWSEEKAGRWSASGQRVEDLAEAIRRGEYPAGTTPGDLPQAS